MDAPAAAIAAPTIPAAVQLDESASLRVLAGTTTYLAEAKKAKPDFADLDKDGDKKEPMKKAAKEAKVDEATKPAKAKKAEKKEEKEEAVEENFEFKSKFMKMVEAKKKPAAKKGENPFAKKDDKKSEKKGAAPKKGVNPFAKKDDKKEAPKAKAKKTVKESVEQKLTFKQMVQLVQESGGQQQIDATDKELFAWAQRVAASKFNESVKSELYAGMVYERMGGVFEMYDVLAESKK
jgi:hypothetical protein